MNKFILSALTFSMLSSAVVANEPPQQKKALKRNNVIFRLNQESGSTTPTLFLVQRHVVTNGQPSNIQDQAYLPHWFHPANLLHHESTTLWVNAGRLKSAAVYNVLAGWGVDTSSTPREMNFALQGTLGFSLSDNKTYICQDIALAQTGKGLNNLWYIFSPKGSGMFHGTRFTDMTCINTESKALRSFRVYSKSSNVFAITPEGAEVEAEA